MPRPNKFQYIDLSLITNLAVCSGAPGSQMAEPKVQIKSWLLIQMKLLHR